VRQNILVFQQNGSGEKKIRGIRRFGYDLISLEIVSIDQSLPPIIDDAANYLPFEIRADLVLDFLTHPDLSLDLFALCRKRRIPVIASGKKYSGQEGIITPPT